MSEPGPLLLDEAQIRSCVDLTLEALSAVEEGFTLLAQGKVLVPAPIGIDIPEQEAEIHVKSAFVRGLPGYAVKIASGFYRNAARGLPSTNGLMIVFSSETGVPLAILLDNGYLTEIRTALAGAIAAKYLASATIRTVGVVGSGSQARYQVRALRLVREFEQVLVWGRRPEAAAACAADIEKELGIRAKAAAEVGVVVRASDILITATASRAPLVRAEDLHDGLLIIAMGSDGIGKQELDARIFSRAQKIACDLKSQCFRLGELQHALAGLTMDQQSSILELGELTSGRMRGRENEKQIAVCDLTGVGVQDTAISLYALKEAGREGARARG
ncbi:MAG TPA: ornithine cyclodeaminase family protein [Vicinamibacteria bacterium]|jgi:ectoine utilization protein EutC|nr:ornithine cyclodeaminase family protein [Vicinamibacteria bacterium]